MKCSRCRSHGVHAKSGLQKAFLDPLETEPQRRPHTALEQSPEKREERRTTMIRSILCARKINFFRTIELLPSKSRTCILGANLSLGCCEQSLEATKTHPQLTPHLAIKSLKKAPNPNKVVKGLAKIARPYDSFFIRLESDEKGSTSR